MKHIVIINLYYLKYFQAIGQQLLKETQRSVDLDIYFGNNTEDGLSKTNAGFRMDLDRIWQLVKYYIIFVL